MHVLIIQQVAIKVLEITSMDQITFEFFEISDQVKKKEKEKVKEKEKRKRFQTKKKKTRDEKNV